MKILVLSQYFWPENFRINELTKELKKDSEIPIILLTARGEVSDRIKGLELGAEGWDYLFKHCRRDTSSLVAILALLDNESLRHQRRLTLPFFYFLRP